MPLPPSGPSCDSTSTRASSSADYPIADEHDAPLAGAAEAPERAAPAAPAAPLCPAKAATDDLLVPASVPVEGCFPLGMVLDDCPPGRILVTSVVDGSWAAEHGIQPGDEVVALNGAACRGAAQEDVQRLGRQRPLRIRVARGASGQLEDAQPGEQLEETLTPTVAELEERLRSAQRRAEVAEQRLAALAAESNGQDAESISESVRAYQERVAVAERRIADAGRRATNALLALSATSGLDGGDFVSSEVVPLAIRDAYSDEKKPDLCWGCYPGHL